MVQPLAFQSPDVQKVLVCEGAFEKLFNVTQEGDVDGGCWGPWSCTFSSSHLGSYG